MLFDTEETTALTLCDVMALEADENSDIVIGGYELFLRPDEQLKSADCDLEELLRQHADKVAGWCSNARNRNFVLIFGVTYIKNHTDIGAEYSTKVALIGLADKTKWTLEGLGLADRVEI